MLNFDRQILSASGKISTSCQISPNGELIAISQDTNILIFDVLSSTITKLTTTHMGCINCLCWSPDSKCIASGSEDFTIEITHVLYGRIRRLMGHTAPVISICYNSRGNILCSSSVDESIKEWHVLSGTALKTMSAHSDPVVSIDIPKYDSSVLSSGSYDGLIRIFDTESGHCLKTLTYDKDWISEDGVVPISTVKFSKNGKLLLVKSLDNVVKLWDYTRGTVVRTFLWPYQEAKTKLKYNCGLDLIYPQGSDPLVISGDDSGALCIWNAYSKNLVQNINDKHRNSPLISISASHQLITTLSLNGECNLFRL
ncbi:unnamed protein product [Kluyveromyces dobzhanskii CBS 2104]|uniref:WGS project CCBQ000000000 data, contig 00006 n=1 Tax=Kluyveromyces dobzhanskii CBS 2104 TaxID=1427455 RepID=A0A0A8LAE1_9SACH|nr:unnamed protein product [Kluyveromyces dobzhanskii CBS 2104]